ncbi:hypothetical protein [Glaciimonas immobilis]|uniref:Uncharacterized protein n=1 Tax=Glaciimonas immobilis TaxID=728004 RepID=A0A840RQ01_9BURK|nr:hypothetical protein [Glaciimonas immobilis]KAF3999241.1 hypothetical protein HAV38_04700 [Glaciimonas immobilis]MBB5198700.1 hypothetical protein [Glaciimonas immobilis]
MFMQEESAIFYGVGGALINCVCSEYGHCYQNRAGASAWGNIVVADAASLTSEQLKKTGMYNFSYNVCTPIERGIAMVGLFFDQSNIGFIYDPLHYDEPIKIKNTNVIDFSALVINAATVLSRINDPTK